MTYMKETGEDDITIACNNLHNIQYLEVMKDRISTLEEVLEVEEQQKK